MNKAFEERETALFTEETNGPYAEDGISLTSVSGVMDIGTYVEPRATTSFTAAGNNLIYVDSPERFDVNANTLHYLYGTGISTSYKDVEFYHFFNNNWDNSSTVKVGVAVLNLNSTTKTVTAKRGTIQYLRQSSTSDANALSVTPSAILTFLNASATTISVPAYSRAVVWLGQMNFEPGKALFVNGHAAIKSNAASNVYMRVFVAGANRNPTDVFDIASPLSQPNSPTFCGELDYSQLNASFSANSVTSSDRLRLFPWPATTTSPNNGEYRVPIAIKPGSISLHAGNYGVIYKLSISDASGKNINVYPDWSVAGRTKARLLLRRNNGAWQIGSELSVNEGYYMSLGSGSSATLELIMPGGNYGNWIAYCV